MRCRTSTSKQATVCAAIGACSRPVLRPALPRGTYYFLFQVNSVVNNTPRSSSILCRHLSFTFAFPTFLCCIVRSVWVYCLALVLHCLLLPNNIVSNTLFLQHLWKISCTSSSPFYDYHEPQDNSLALSSPDTSNTPPRPRVRNHPHSSWLPRRTNSKTSRLYLHTCPLAIMRCETATQLKNHHDLR
jgi:hypothetical protein